jgi:hypothetical protein
MFSRDCYYLLYSWPDLETQPTDDTTLRHEQIKLRLAEIEEVIGAMTRLSQGDDVRRTSIDSPDFDWNRWADCIDTAKPVMAGHSLGGSAAVCICYQASLSLSFSLSLFLGCFTLILIDDCDALLID